MKLTWKRAGGVYRSLCGRYTIEKYDSIMRGSTAWWVVSGATTGQRKTLRIAKRLAELHASGSEARQ